MKLKVCLLSLLVFCPFLAVVSAGWFGKSEEPASPDVRETLLQMPGVIPQQNDSYLCTSFPLNEDETHFIVGYSPHADAHKVHHILLFGCEEPGSGDEVWDCGEMSTANARYQRSPPCAGQPDILYAWAKNAPKLELPKGVGFRVGSGTRNQQLVLQVHYMHALQEEEEDTSGLRVSSTTLEQPKTASTLLLATGGAVAPKSTEQFEAACVVDEDVQLHPFAFRVHTHRHGTKVSGWVVNPTADGNEEGGAEQWHLVGERNPQLPQMFEPVTNKTLVVKGGDVVAARCTIKNDEDRVVQVGPTGDDEMCNFYMMYWVDGDRVLQDNTCFSPGPPEYYWSRSGLGEAMAHH